MSSLQMTLGGAVLGYTTAAHLADARRSSRHVILRKPYRKVGQPKS